MANCSENTDAPGGEAFIAEPEQLCKMNVAPWNPGQNPNELSECPGIGK
jgi:hypothetical protein